MRRESSSATRRVMATYNMRLLASPRSVTVNGSSGVTIGVGSGAGLSGVASVLAELVPTLSERNRVVPTLATTIRIIASIDLTNLAIVLGSFLAMTGRRGLLIEEVAIVVICVRGCARNIFQVITLWRNRVKAITPNKGSKAW